MIHPGQVIGPGTVVFDTELRPGDRITEVETPDGEWYPVTRVSAKSFWVDAGDGAEVRFSVKPHAVVLRAN